MKLKCLFDFRAWKRGEVIELPDAEARALVAGQYRHFQIVAEPVVVEALDAPPADKMIRKPRGKK